MLDRLEAAFVGQRRVPRRRRPRAEDPAHRAPRPPRAARRRQPGGDRRDPRAAAGRDRPDVAAGRRADPAGQERPARLRDPPAGRPHRADRRHAGQGPRAGRPHLDPRRDRQRHGPGRRAAAHPGPAPALRQRGQAHRRPATWSPSGRRTTARPRGSGSATPVPGSRPRTASRSSSGSAAAPCRTTTRGSVWACPSSARSRRAHGGTLTLEDEQPHGARFVITLPIPGVEPTDPGDRTQDETEDEEFSLWPAS